MHCGCGYRHAGAHTHQEISVALRETDPRARSLAIPCAILQGAGPPCRADDAGRSGPLVERACGVVAEAGVAVRDRHGLRRDDSGWLLHQRGVRAATGIDMGDGRVGTHAFFVLTNRADARDEFQFLLRGAAGRRVGCRGRRSALGHGQRCLVALRLRAARPRFLRRLDGAFGGACGTHPVGFGVALAALALQRLSCLVRRTRQIGIGHLAGSVGAPVDLRVRRGRTESARGSDGECQERRRHVSFPKSHQDQPIQREDRTGGWLPYRPHCNRVLRPC
ncbi:hypothetical protein XACW160_430071 [Xanthomonas citri pv. citri]|nr:hypothetical protein XACW160_430071 [Xanthomonas citri pv. citri]CEE70414.1 hypothetical protein XAC2852_470052 [Xanthomonas citri pv. citri]CEH53735.1 hypothetical protein XACG102_5240013 [Xanthomonas citri pv. citri]CEH64317.1 hypothetical protein XAC3610_6060013 [Xanthomonas citri pv. citri]CEH94165.1 hypothetical protein XACG115_1310008 [Xanthomonas citri pv. citri]